MHNYAGANSFPGTVPVLDDGDPPAATTWAPCLEGLADRTQYLYTRRLTSDDVFVTNVADGDGGSPNTVTSFTTTSFVEQIAASVTATDCVAGDVLLLDVHGQAAVLTGGNDGRLQIYRREDVTGTNVKVTDGFSYCRISSTTPGPFSFTARFVIGNSGDCRVGIEGKETTGSGSATVRIYGGFVIRVVRIKKAA